MMKAYEVKEKANFDIWDDYQIGTYSKKIWLCPSHPGAPGSG